MDKESFGVESSSEIVQENNEVYKENKSKEKERIEAILDMGPKQKMGKSEIFGIGISNKGSTMENILEGIVRLDCSAQNVV